jgi:hypothetical protein
MNAASGLFRGTQFYAGQLRRLGGSRSVIVGRSSREELRRKGSADYYEPASTPPVAQDACRRPCRQLDREGGRACSRGTAKTLYAGRDASAPDDEHAREIVTTALALRAVCDTLECWSERPS